MKFDMMMPGGFSYSILILYSNVSRVMLTQERQGREYYFQYTLEPYLHMVMCKVSVGVCVICNFCRSAALIHACM